MRLRFLFILVLITMVIISCDSKERVPVSEAGQNMSSSPSSTAPAAAHKIYVDEAIQGNTYTYLKVTEGDLEYWIATAKQPIEAGATMYYDQGLEMKDFTSKEVDRTFESIWFVGQMRGTSSAASQMSKGSPKTAAVADAAVEKIEGGVTVQDLYAGQAGFAGKAVTIRGTVTKFNAEIMGRNWVHVQDGTSAGDKIDVTITTAAVVKMGDVVVFQGVVALNKDFGAGYSYELILEEAKLIENR